MLSKQSLPQASDPLVRQGWSNTQQVEVLAHLNCPRLHMSILPRTACWTKSS